MFSFFRKNSQGRGIRSLISKTLELEYDEKKFLHEFHAEAGNDWHDFEENGHNHKDFSAGLFIISALKIFRIINKNESVVKTLTPSVADKVFLECVFFTCCAIAKLDDEGYLTDLYGRTGEFYKLDGAEFVIEKIIDLYAETPQLSVVHPQEIVDMWEDRIQYYCQVNKESSDNIFKSLCYLFSLAIRSHGDMPFKNVLDIDLQDSALLSPTLPLIGIVIQSAAEQSIFELIKTAKKTMYGYSEKDLK